MADLLSDHYNSTAASATIEDPRPFVARGLSHATVRYKRATVTTTTATAAADVMRFFTLKSSDRVVELLLSHTADASTSATGNAGVHATIADEGAVYDINLWCAVGTVPMSDITAAIARVDLYTLGALELEDRGKALWENIEEGETQSWTVDPLLEFDITITVAAETGIVATEYVLECYYTSE